MYHIAVQFDVEPERRDDFIAAALEDGRGSLADEPDTERYELISDIENRNRFYLYEVYKDQDSFARHFDGVHCRRFLELISEYATAPKWLVNGYLVEDPSALR